MLSSLEIVTGLRALEHATQGIPTSRLITNMGDPDTVAPATYSYTAINYQSTYYNTSGVSTTYNGTQTNITPTSGSTSTRTVSLARSRSGYLSSN